MENPQIDKTGVTTLYYDGNCPLCTSEMARLETLKSEELQLVDIHSMAASSDQPDRDTLLRTLHLRQPDGRWLTGADANVAAWQFTQRGVWFRWLRWPVLRGLVDFIYEIWARRRYNRLYSKRCALGENR
jgi:predicted DCC family thiol-disulfide oxidoreductase YuxK